MFDRNEPRSSATMAIGSKAEAVGGGGEEDCEVEEELPTNGGGWLRTD